MRSPFNVLHLVPCSSIHLYLSLSLSVSLSLCYIVAITGWCRQILIWRSTSSCMTRFPLRVTERTTRRRKEGKREKKMKKKNIVKRKRRVYPNGVTLTLVCSVLRLTKAKLTRRTLAICLFSLLNFIWESSDYFILMSSNLINIS